MPAFREMIRRESPFTIQYLLKCLGGYGKTFLVIDFRLHDQIKLLDKGYNFGIDRTRSRHAALCWESTTLCDLNK